MEQNMKNRKHAKNKTIFFLFFSLIFSSSILSLVTADLFTISGFEEDPISLDEILNITFTENISSSYYELNGEHHELCSYDPDFFLKHSITNESQEPSFGNWPCISSNNTYRMHFDDNKINEFLNISSAEICFNLVDDNTGIEGYNLVFNINGRENHTITDNSSIGGTPSLVCHELKEEDLLDETLEVYFWLDNESIPDWDGLEVLMTSNINESGNSKYSDDGGEYWYDLENNAQYDIYINISGFENCSGQSASQKLRYERGSNQIEVFANLSNGTSQSFSREIIFDSVGISMKPFTVYYGWPSYVNGANGNVDAAVAEFEKYDLIIFPEDLATAEYLTGTEHGDKQNTIQIISDLKEKGKKVFGYIAVGACEYCRNWTIQNMSDMVDIYKYDYNMTGIFFDEFGYDYNVSKERQNSAIDTVYSEGVEVILNGGDVGQTLGNEYDPVYNSDEVATEIAKVDYYMSENFGIDDQGNLMINEWIYQKGVSQINYKNEHDIEILSLATGNDSQQDMNWTKYNLTYYLSAMFESDYFNYQQVGYAATENDYQDKLYHEANDISHEIGSQNEYGEVYWLDEHSGILAKFSNKRMFINGSENSYEVSEDNFDLSGFQFDYSKTINPESVDLSISANNAMVEWYAPVNISGRDFTRSVVVDENFISFNISELGEEYNSSASVSFSNINCADFDVYYFPNFMKSKDFSKGEIIATEAGCIGNICSGLECQAGVVSFDAAHFDGFGVQNGVAVPEFSDYAMILALTLVIGIFIHFRRR